MVFFRNHECATPHTFIISSTTQKIPSSTHNLSALHCGCAYLRISIIIAVIVTLPIKLKKYNFTFMYVSILNVTSDTYYTGEQHKYIFNVRPCG